MSAKSSLLCNFCFNESTAGADASVEVSKLHNIIKGSTVYYIVAWLCAEYNPFYQFVFLHLRTEKSCFDDGNGSLNEWSLEHLINTVSPNTFVHAPGGDLYYATTDYGRTLNTDSDPHRVLFSSSLRLGRSPPPEKILLNFPPYMNTSLYFIGTFGSSNHKPAIGILGMFGSDGLSMTIDRLKCIAKMKYLGFKLIPWNIDDFKESVNDACDDRIEQAVSSNGFTDELTNVEKLIQFVTEMSQNPNVQNWCLTTPTMLANIQTSHVKVKMRY